MSATPGRPKERDVDRALREGAPMSLVLHQRTGPVATLTLNRPHMANALVPELLEEVRAALIEIRNDREIRALVLAANGPAFSIGGDMRRFCAEMAGGAIRSYSARLVGLLNAVVLALVDLPQPVVAAVHGTVTGGSLGFLLGADLVVMADDAVLKAHYASAGFCPDGGWSALLPEFIGGRRAAAGLLLNRSLRASEALAWGLVNDLAPAAEVGTVAHSWAAKIAAHPAPTMGMAKRLLRHDRATLAARLEAERAGFLALIAGAEARQGVADFLARFQDYPSAPQ